MQAGVYNVDQGKAVVIIKPFGAPKSNDLQLSDKMGQVGWAGFERNYVRNVPFLQ